MFAERNIVQDVKGAGNTVEQFDKESDNEFKEHHQREQLE